MTSGDIIELVKAIDPHYNAEAAARSINPQTVAFMEDIADYFDAFYGEGTNVPRGVFNGAVNAESGQIHGNEN